MRPRPGIGKRRGPTRAGVGRLGRVIAICNPKGGVAKTTSAFHLGAAWAAMGRRVLWVDLDPQAALTVWGLGTDPAEGAGPNPSGPGGLEGRRLPPTIYQGLLGKVGAEQLLRPTRHGPDLMPAGIELSVAEVELVGQMAPERRLLRLLAPVRDRYDYVLVDCQPSLGLLVQNALAAADEVLVPVACEFLAVRVLALLLRALVRVRVQSNSRLSVLAILPTLYDRRTLHARQALDQIRAAFGQRHWVAQWPVVKSVRFAEAAERGVAVWALSPLHPGGEAYRALAAAVEGARVPRPPEWWVDEDEARTVGLGRKAGPSEEAPVA